MAPTKTLTRRRKACYALAVWLVIALVAYTISLVVRVPRLYWDLKAGAPRGAVPADHVFDEVLGWRPAPGPSAWTGILHDEGGFRIPKTPKPDRAGRPLVLCLGCSFTYGSCAEHPWPEVLGDRLDARVVNGGVGGWGLVQMLLRARKLIPELHPDWVVVQASPWLADRSQSPLAAHRFGYNPQPWFAPDLAIVPPSRPPRATFRLTEWRSSDSSLGDFLDFVPTGVQAVIWQDRLVASTVFARSAPREEIEVAAYREIAALARGRASAVVVVNRECLGADAEARRLVEELRPILPVVDCGLHSAAKRLEAPDGHPDDEGQALIAAWAVTTVGMR